MIGILEFKNLEANPKICIFKCFRSKICIEVFVSVKYFVTIMLLPTLEGTKGTISKIRRSIVYIPIKKRQIFGRVLYTKHWKVVEDHVCMIK